MVADELIAATDEALREVAELRFLRTERGFHGRFYCALHQVLEKKGLLKNGCILKMEYQKSDRHGTSKRPDIVLHVPVEESGARVDENNYAVWALKRRATKSEANDDFEKLDIMFGTLCYPLGLFINIDAKRHLAASYRGRFPERLCTVAVWLDGTVHTNWGAPSRAPENAARPQRG